VTAEGVAASNLDELSEDASGSCEESDEERSWDSFDELEAAEKGG
jgi:hypothetical protein